MPVKRELPAKIGRCSEKLLGHNFDRRAKSSWEKIFKYVKNFLSGGFCSKVKIAACQVFVTPPYFCWQLAFYRHLPTSGRQNTVKTAPQPLRIHICIFQEWSQYPNNLSATWNSYNKDTVAFCKCEICTCECPDLMKQLIFQGYGVFICTKCWLLAGFLFENIVLQVGAD